MKSISIKKMNIRPDMLYLSSFLVPVLIMLVIFVIQHIYPFGERSFLHIDMYHQYFPFLVEFLSQAQKTGRVSFTRGTPASAPTSLPSMCTIWQVQPTGSVSWFPKISDGVFVLYGCHQDRALRADLHLLYQKAFSERLVGNPVFFIVLCAVRFHGSLQLGCDVA